MTVDWSNEWLDWLYPGYITSSHDRVQTTRFLQKPNPVDFIGFLVFIRLFWQAGKNW